MDLDLQLRKVARMPTITQRIQSRSRWDPRRRQCWPRECNVSFRDAHDPGCLNMSRPLSRPSATRRYRGRFAPSPTGPLHFGSLVAALGSFLDARANDGEWLVRIEDLDPPREMPGAADHILFTLDAFGFEWSGAVLYQSRRLEAYERALKSLEARGFLYRCRCTRKEIANAIAARSRPMIRQQGSADRLIPEDPDTRESVYPGTCRAATRPILGTHAKRIRVGDVRIGFTDALQGHIEQSLADEVGDFVLQRADGLFAYQLAVVVDDAEQGITDIVRGADLLDSTPRQIFLGQILGDPPLQYLHLPVAVDKDGAKLSKQTRATPLTPHIAPAATLCAALRFLGHAPPREAAAWTPHEILAWGTSNWWRLNLPKTRALTYPGPAAA